MAEQDIAQATTIVDRNILSTPADPIHIDIYIYILHHKLIIFCDGRRKKFQFFSSPITKNYARNPLEWSHSREKYA